MRAILQIPAPKFKSKLEAAYAKHLDLRVQAGEVLRWRYEAVTFALGGGARFTPDFYVLVPLQPLGEWGCQIELHETKGHWREAAKVRMKVASEMYDEFEWRVVSAKTTGKTHATATLILPTLKIETPAEALARRSK